MSRIKKAFLIILAFLLADLGALAYVDRYSFVIPTEPRQRGASGGIWRGMIKTQSDNPEVKITFLNIGQGDAAYVRFPNGEDMLIDCAKDARILSALGRVMDSGDHTIDYLVVSHAHADHYGGCIDVMKRFTVKHIVYNGYKKESDPVWRWWWETVQKEGAVYDEITREQTWTIASSTIHFLYPDHPVAGDPPANQSGDEGHVENNMSIVMTIRYGPSNVLFTGDMEKDLEDHLIQKFGKKLHSDILKAGHHGSPNSSNKEFLAAVSPHDTVISVGENKYGHPSHRVLKRLGRVPSTIWRTDEDGDITAILDGNGASVQASK